MSAKKKRSANFSSSEERLLIALVKQFKDIIECKKSGHITWQQKVSAWKSLQEQFNARSTGEFRDLETIKQKYQNLKKSAEQKFSAEKRSLRKTGGGGYKMVDVFSDIDMEIKDILGDQIEGLPSLCDSDSAKVESSNEAPPKNNKEVFTFVVDNEGNINHSNTSILSSDDRKSVSNSSVQEVQVQVVGEKCLEDTNVETEKSGNCSSKDWSAYSSSMLKEPPNQKLKTKKAHGKQSGSLAFKKNSNEQLIAEKISFLNLQKEQLRKEHRLKMKIYTYKYLVNKKKAESLGISLKNESKLLQSVDSESD